ncbi:MAG: hypothetical protein CFE24_03750 [Flavobacterium sp. BFFFF2]|nr:MAG: hypothetical protein CFE24_03750 [Flavobacterium sp. BFFFF2]
MLISFIIPAYKVEDYLEKCLLSILHQPVDASLIEVVVTNDGSPDSCQSIVEGLQQKYTNLKLINQENQGVSMARNHAIAAAAGQYIIPIDADDALIADSLTGVVQFLQACQPDIAYLPFEVYNAQGKCTWKSDFTALANQDFDGIDGYYACRGLSMIDPDRSWAIAYKRTLINAHQIGYPKDVPILEDGEFVAKCFSVAQKIQFYTGTFYRRTMRDNSAINSTTRYNDKAMRGFLLAARDLRQFESTLSPVSGKQAHFFNHITAKYILTPFLIAFTTKKWSRVRFVQQLMRNTEFEKLPSEGVRGTYTNYVRYYNLSIFVLWFFFLFRRFKK